MVEPSQSWILNNGLQVNFICCPESVQSAALLLVRAGSHQEPEQWPGLAHLTEHLLFAGGDTYQGSQRLMPWLMSRYGQVNATTRVNSTSYYFQVADDELMGGVLRLLDMALSPTIELHRIAQETAIIDAEFQLLSSERLTQLTAILMSQISYPSSFTQCHIGRQQDFGDDMIGLSQAVMAFHHRYYQPQNMQLWITSSKSAQQIEQQFSLATLPLQSVPKLEIGTLPALSDRGTLHSAVQDGRVALTGDAGITLCYLGTGRQLGDSALLPLLQQLIKDRAPGTYLDFLQQRKPGISVNIHLLCHDKQQLLLMIDYQGGQLTVQDVAKVSHWTRQWLLQCASLDNNTLAHYCQLAWRTFTQLPLMEQLRQRALQLSPPSTPLEANVWQRFVLSLVDQQPIGSRLYSCHDKSLSDSVFAGITMGFQPESFLAVSAMPSLPRLTFYPILPVEVPMLDTKPLNDGLYLSQQVTSSITLILSLSYAQALSAENKACLQDALQPAFDLLLHEGGQGEWRWQCGYDHLCFSASTLPTILRVLQLLQQCWPREARRFQRHNNIPVKQLMARLPALVAGDPGSNTWISLVSGVEAWQQPQIGRYLGQLPICWSSTPLLLGAEKQSKSQVIQFSADHDHALVAFIPFPTGIASLSAWCQLAQIYQQQAYQWLRETHGIGYVVTCHYQRMVEKEGIVIMLQSPHFTANELKQWTLDFFSMISQRFTELNDKAFEHDLHHPQRADQGQHIDRLIEELEGIRQSSSRCQLAEKHGRDLNLIFLHQSMVKQLSHDQVFWLLTSVEP